MTTLEVRHEFQGSLIEVQKGSVYVYRSYLKKCVSLMNWGLVLGVSKYC